MEIIKLDLVPGGCKPILHASQYDIGRQWWIELLNNGVPYVLQEDDVVEYEIRKGDGLVVTGSIAYIPGATYVILVSTEQMCAIYGSNLGELKISSNGAEIGTGNFILDVEKATTGGEKSKSVIWDLQAQVDDCTQKALENIGAKGLPFNNEDTDLEATNTEDAIKEVDSKVNEKADASSLAEVATSGSYNDLLDKPSIPAAQVNSDWDANSGVSQILNKPNLSTVATTGDYNDLLNKPAVAVIDDTTASASKVYSSEKVDSKIGDLFVPNYVKYAFYNIGGVAKLDIAYSTWRTCIFECFAYVGKTLTVKTYNNNIKPIYAVNDNFEVLGTYTTTDTTSTTEKTYNITIPVGATMLLIPVYNNPEGAYDVVVSGMTIADDIDNKADIVDNKIGTVYIPNNYAKYAYYNNNGVATINAGLSTYKNISFDCKSYVGKTVIVSTYNTSSTPIFATDDNKNIIAEYKYSSGNVAKRTYYITIPVGATQLLINCYNNPVDTYFIEVKATVGNELLTIRNDIKNLRIAFLLLRVIILKS